MVQTRSAGSEQGSGGGNSTDPMAAKLDAIMAKLKAIDNLKADMAILKAKDKSKGGLYDEGTSSFRGSQYHRPFNKIEFSMFNGGDPRGWLLKADKYFRYYQIGEEDKVEIAAMHLEGEALDLYSWMATDQPLMIWADLVQAFNANFGPAEFQNPDEHLCSVKQTSTVQAYRQEFAKRSARVTNWPDHCLLGVFLNGLKEELRTDVRIHKPRTVYNAMSLALEFEAKLEQLKGSKGTAGSSNLKAAVTEIKLTAPATNQPYVTQKSPLRITDAEKQSRFLKGECFRCGDKYGPGHRCKTGALQVYEMEQEPKGQQYVTSSAIEEITEDMAEISLHAILGKQQPTAMKVYGLLGATEVLILVDGGSTHNFISDTLVRELNLATENIRPIGVQIGNGDVIRCNQVCKDLKLQVQELEVMQDFYPFSLGGADIVLGIRWLATLNTVHANWREMSMVFSIDNKRYKLQGVPTGSPQSASFQYFAGDEDGGPTRPQLFQDFMRQSGPAPRKNGLEDKSLFHGGRIDTYLSVAAQGEEAVMCCPRVQHLCAPETN